jgi:UDP-GlcNAc:undecaprenyl-phosphate GlcNAc-1-phosphate transferase
MITYLVTFLVSLMVGVVATLGVRNRAFAYGWLDQAKNSRKVHEKPVPRLGGVAIVCGFFAPLVALLWVDSGVGHLFRSQQTLVLGLFAGGLAIAVLGLYDDFRGADARLKFSVQLAVALALYALGFRIPVIANPFGAPLELGMLSLPFTLLWMVGVVNAMNLIDGLDGLAGGVAFFGVGTNFLLALFRGDVMLCLIMAALAGAVLGFLIFNFNPASIFMGDTGSMFLGFVLAAVSIKTSAKSGTAVAMAVPIIALGLPITDTILAVIRRSLLGRPVFSADKEHIHHRLMSRLSLSHRHAVLALYGLCCLFAAVALCLSFANGVQSALLLSGVAVVVGVMMRRLGYLTMTGRIERSHQRKRNIRLRGTVRELIGTLDSARTMDGIWEAIRPLSAALEASRFELRLEKDNQGTRDGRMFAVGPVAPEAPSLVLPVEVKHEDQVLGVLAVSWADGRIHVNRDEEFAVEVVADSVAKAVAQLSSAASMKANGKVVWLRK